MESEQIWQAAQEELRFQLSKPSYETWLKNASLVGREKNSFKIGVPTKLAKDWLEDRYSAMIKETLSAIVSGDVSVSFEVVATQVEPASRRAAVAVADAEEPVTESEDPVLDEASQLNPKFQFQHFVVGNNSRFAHAACRAVAETPAKAYNPLFLYGGVGLGKTHLMHAIGHAVLEKHHRRKVAYVTSEKFMNEMITSIQEGRMNDFRTRYRTVDVLLVDDIQFLAGKDRTQEEFFHTFNSLHELNRQIVISSDRPPKEIPTLEDRLRSRFSWGLIADIQPADFETRVAILKSKVGPYARLVPEDVISFIAHKIQRNIRELEGALIRVIAHASLNRSPVNVDMAATLLQDVIPSTETRTLSIDTIARAVANFYHISLEEMKGKRRDKHIVFPRQVAMFLIREETASSLPAIGQAFGGRDHTTVLHSYEKISTEAREDQRLQADLRKLREILYSH
ncbi:MAG: chromosomal replication initiator protein DnaA [Chloroflexi bacterium]|nr:MAG: chromosomal replication initiator protein DnaA [Chloroflexota bacterium]TME47291.1 MAG: chromosomal replication initiator protein DnaA [Chloroflexota bacterium]